MIYTEVEEIKWLDTFDTIAIPVYTDADEVNVDSSPTWVSLTSTGVVSGKSFIYITPIGNDSTYYSDVLILSDADSNTITIPLIYDFDSTSVSVREIIDNISLQNQEGSYYDGMERNTLVMLAKKGIQQMNIMSAGGVNRAELQLSDTSELNTPFDMVSPIALYGIDNNGALHRLYESKNVNLGAHNFTTTPSEEVILSDTFGYAIETNGVGAEVTTPDYYRMKENQSLSVVRSVKGGQRTQAGQYFYDKQTRRFSIFASPYETFLLEYNSDPLVREQVKADFESLRIQKYFVEPLENWIYWKWVERRKDVPRSEVVRAKQEWGQSERLARRASINTSALLQSLKSNIG